MRSKQPSPQVRNARCITLPTNKQEADELVAAIIEGRHETTMKGQAGWTTSKIA